MSIRILATYLVLTFFSYAYAQDQASHGLISSANPEAEVYILSPKHNQIVSSPVKVVFGASNVNIVAAGDNQPNSGHHHLLVDLTELPDLSMPLPATEQIIHFGNAQSDTEIELAPGTHTLQLLLGDYLHIPHQKPLISEKITIIVE